MAAQGYKKGRWAEVTSTVDQLIRQKLINHQAHKQLLSEIGCQEKQ